MKTNCSLNKVACVHTSPLLDEESKFAHGIVSASKWGKLTKRFTVEIRDLY